jgi:hypothetical protein
MNGPLASAARLPDLPSRTANAARNALAEPEREARWRPARDALWALLEPLVPAGGAVAVAGAGNAHDLPLTRLLARAGAVELLDVDPRPACAALAREPPALARRGRVRRVDVTDGAADRVVREVRDARPLGRALGADAPAPLGEARHDVAIGDLLYTQLLYPGLVDAGVPAARRAAVLAEQGQALTDLAVARLHASAPVVVHVHDALGWWPGHGQPRTLQALLRLSPSRALRAIRDANEPRGCDVRAAIGRAGATVEQTALWRWPFRTGVDYLVVATVARSAAVPAR